jgi:nicotinamide-nucleotide amidase
MVRGNNPEVGLLASAGEIKIRITAKASDSKDARELIRPVEDEIRARLGDKIFGQDDDTLEQVVVELLLENRLTLAVLETFTGGMMAQLLYQVPGSRLIGSRVIPDREGVQKYLQAEKTVPCKDAAKALAQKVREDVGADVGLALVGFQEEDKGRYLLDADVGVVSNGLSREFFSSTGGDPAIVRQRGAVMGLNALRLALSR